MSTQHVTTFRLHSGETVLVRPLERADGVALASAVERMSELSRYHRFHTGLSGECGQLIWPRLVRLSSLDLAPPSGSGGGSGGVSSPVLAPPLGE
jgi:hypothetical protein